MTARERLARIKERSANGWHLPLANETFLITALARALDSLDAISKEKGTPCGQEAIEAIADINALAAGGGDGTGGT